MADLLRFIVGDVAAISRLAELEREVVRRLASDHQLSKMHCPMVEIAYSDDISELMPSAVTLIFHVMHVEPDVPAAPGHTAAVSVSGEHLFSLASGHTHRRPLGSSGIE